MSLSPITLFVYNRPEHTRKTVEALRNNLLASESDLFIFSDSWKDENSKKSPPERPDMSSSRAGVENVRAYIRTISGFKSVHINEQRQNLGLANSIIAGVTEIVNRFGTVIVMEDDLVTSPYFLTYMNEGLDLYEKEEKVISIHGYTYPVKESLPETFFLRGADCWGWATWKRGWDLFESDGQILLTTLEERNLIRSFDFDGAKHFSGMLRRQIKGQNNSWAIRWNASAFILNKLTLYPGISLVNNIGQDATGTHGGNSDENQTLVSAQKIKVGGIDVEENTIGRQAFKKYFQSLKPSIWQRIIMKISPRHSHRNRNPGL